MKQISGWRKVLASVFLAVMLGAFLAASPQQELQSVESSATNSQANNAAMPAPQAASSSILGFTPSSAVLERKTEAEFWRIPSAERTAQWHRYFTAEPHPAASARNNELAGYIAAQWRQQGWEDVVLRKYEVYDSARRQTSLEMVAPVHYRASLREDAYAADPDTKNPRVSPAYLGYSASGDVTAEVVYAHSGNPDDYDLLRKNGISVKGKIVLVRYSNPYSYRGFKALTAEREGAAAMLVYSDPAEDGYTKGKVCPDGPWGPGRHIQP